MSEPTKSIEEMSKEEFKEHKKNADAFNNKRHNEADHKRKIGISCMFHVNIYADLCRSEVSYRSHVITSYFQTGLM